ncbi:MAG: Npt1/Npt2 family nucleotide transporter [Parachlamydiaceae bacterium]
MSVALDSQFGPIRSLIWPIHRHEVRKLLPMVIMLFLICFNHSALRSMKDALVITSAGAEVIPFIKVWAILPMAVLVTLIFTKLSNRFSQENVFYIMTTGFLICYAIFAFILYPSRDALHPHELADTLEKTLPAGFKGLISMFRYWTFTAFYVMSELWSTSIMTVLFWGFANEITRLTEARRFYSVLSIVSNFASIAAGSFSVSVACGEVCKSYIPFGKDGWEQTMMIIVSMMIISGILTMITFRWMNRRVLSDPSYDDLHKIKKEIKMKGRLSFRESLSYVMQSRYLLCIAAIVIGYNLVINLVEVVWKDQMRKMYPSPADYNSYVNNLLVIQGIASTFLALSMAKLIKRFGWSTTALITPVVMMITCLGFFGFIFCKEQIGDYATALLGMSPLAIAVWFGSAQNALSKATKYSVFDATKEMTYIPLDHESKLKGKAAIDGVGSRFGKSGGSLIHQGLLMVFSTVTASAPYVACILVGAIVIWMFAVKLLGRQFNSLIEEKEAAESTKVQEAPQLSPA